MRMLRQLSQLIHTWPPWVVTLVGVLLVAYSLASVYGRLNTSFGSKIFSKIPPDEIQSNFGHIIQYTIVPVVVTIGYFYILSGNQD